MLLSSVSWLIARDNLLDLVLAVANYVPDSVYFQNLKNNVIKILRILKGNRPPLAWVRKDAGDHPDEWYHRFMDPLHEKGACVHKRL